MPPDISGILVCLFRRLRWTSAPGSKPTWKIVGGPLTHGTTRQGSGGFSLRPVATPQTWRSPLLSDRPVSRSLRSSRMRSPLTFSSKRRIPRVRRWDLLKLSWHYRLLSTHAMFRCSPIGAYLPGRQKSIDLAKQPFPTIAMVETPTRR